MTLGEFYSDARLDDTEREQWIALWDYENNLCPQCGRPVAVCSDPDQLFYPQRSICYATAARLGAERRYLKLAERAKAPDGALDGDSIWVATQDLSPDDDFLQEGIDLPDDSPDDVEGVVL